MSTLSSSSTFAQVQASYADNCSYQEDGSLTKARAFVTACRLLLLKLPMRTQKEQAGEVQYDMGLIRQQLDDANIWIGGQPASGAGGGVKFSDFSTFRD